MLEMVARKSDLKIEPSVKFRLRIHVRMPSINFRSRIWQNGHRIWTQRAKTMKMDYLFVFFGAQMPKYGFRDIATVPAG